MKRKAPGWLTLFFAAIALAALSKGFICRLACGDFLSGILLITTLFLPELLDWMWHLPLRRIDISISCDPLKPSASELCQSIRSVLRRAYSDGGNYLVYIAPMPNTGMRFAFNLVKQRIEAKCGSNLFSADASNYQLPPFAFDDSPVVYCLSGDEDECVDGAYLFVSAKRGEKLHISQLRVNRLAPICVDVLFIFLGVLFDMWAIILGAIILRRTHILKANGVFQYLIIVVAIVLASWQLYRFYW